MSYYENIIIGAGPSSLQCAYYFTKHNINYVILERNNKCGSFFDSYPHAGNLISINKKNTGNDNKDFNLRHDWNSLLNDDDFLFNNYSEDFYPKRESLVLYLNDFSKKYNLNILFNKHVNKISKNKNKKCYEIAITNSEHIFTCKNLIIASGLSKKNIPHLELNVIDEIKHYGDYSTNFFLDKNNLEEFKNKNVLIFGGGNASFELGNIINEVSSSVFIVGRNVRNWALSSHYAGDIRSTYLPFMDTFLLKSLNAIDYNPVFNINHLKITQEESNKPYLVKIVVDELNNEIVDFLPNGRNYYDKIIFCTGWKFDNSIFDFEIDLTKNKKYPLISSNFESTNNINMYFIGALMHSLDFRKSSGGFIHGFRYLIKSFINLNYNIPFECREFNFSTMDDINILTEHIIHRINTSSGLYQMFGYLSDIFYYNTNDRKIFYFENIPINTHSPKKSENTIFFEITLDYGNKISDINHIGRKVSMIGTESKSTLIHPILKIYNSYPIYLIDVIHFDEDLFAEFTDKDKYHYKLFRLLKSYF
jgi:hypothetical protein